MIFCEDSISLQEDEQRFSKDKETEKKTTRQRKRHRDKEKEKEMKQKTTRQSKRQRDKVKDEEKEKPLAAPQHPRDQVPHGQKLEMPEQINLKKKFYSQFHILDKYDLNWIQIGFKRQDQLPAALSVSCLNLLIASPPRNPTHQI